MTSLRFLITLSLFCCCAPLLYAQGDNCANPFNIQANSLPLYHNGVTNWMTDDYQPEGACSGSGNGPDVVYRFTPTLTARYCFAICEDRDGAIYNISLYVRAGSCGGPQIGCTDDPFAGCGNPNLVLVNLTAGVPYYIFVDGQDSSDYGPYILRLDCPNVISMLGDREFTGTTAGEGNHANAPCQAEPAPDVRYSFENVLAASYLIWLTADFDCVLHVRSIGDNCSGFTHVACNHNFCSSSNSSFLRVTLATQTRYYIIVDGYSSSSYGNYTLRMSSDCGITDTICAPGSVISNCTALNPYVVVIPEYGTWRFSTCASAPTVAQVWLREFCDYTPITGLQRNTCGYLTEFDLCLTPTGYRPGIYYVTLEDIPCDDFILSVQPVTTGTCCIFGSNPGCVENVSPCYCDSLLNGYWYPGYTCLTVPCGRPACSEEAMAGQRPYTASESGIADIPDISDDAVSVRLFENLSGLTAPITAVRFWGTAATSSGVPCVEQPLAVSVRFNADSSGFPRLLLPLFQHNYWLTGQHVDDYYSGGDVFQVYQYDVFLPDTIDMSNGWLSVHGVVGSGDPDCYFMWMKSPFGTGSHKIRSNNMWTTGSGDLSYCLDSGTLQIDTACAEDSLAAPAVYSGNTCGWGDDCDLNWGSEDYILHVQIPFADDWTFSLCSSPPGLYSRMYLTTDCCNPASVLVQSDNDCNNQARIPCLSLAAGEYFVVLEANYYSCGAYTLSIDTCRGRCCYGAEGNPSCTVVSETACETLDGIFAMDSSCAAPCDLRPTCLANSELDQPPILTGENGGLLRSEQGSGSQVWENFSGLTSAIETIRFWGLQEDSATGLPCNENPLPFLLTFHPDSAGRPGSQVLSSYNLSVSGIPGNPYNGFPTYEFTATLSPPVNLSSGWLSILGGGLSNCWFVWLSSNAPGESFYHQGRIRAPYPANFSLCLSGNCLSPDSLVVRVELPTRHRHLNFRAPQDGTYQIWRSIDKNAEYPATFTLLSEIVTSAGNASYIDSSPVQDYARYVVVQDCDD